MRRQLAAATAAATTAMGGLFLFDLYAGLGEHRHQFRPGRRIAVESGMEARRGIEKRYVLHAG